MHFDLPPLRIALYACLGLFSFILFALSGARIHYTTHLPKGDPLNSGRNFYDPIVAELLVTTLFTMIWSGFIAYCIHKRAEYGRATTFAAEIVGLFILWLFWIVGASIATSIWGDLSFCQQFHACRLLTALVAFCWLGWIVLTTVLAVTLLFSFANKAFEEPLHGRWDPRASTYQTNRV